MRQSKIARYNSRSIPSERNGSSLRDALTIFFRHSRLIAITFAIIFSCAATYILALPDQYEARMQFLVVDTMLEPGGDETARLHSAASVTTDDINSELHLLRSRDILRMVVESLGLAAWEPASDWPFAGWLPRWLRARPTEEPDDARIARAVSLLQSQLDIKRVESSAIIEVKYAAGNPDNAADVLTKLADFYIEKRIEVRQREGTLEFFEQQSEQHRKDLNEARERLERFNRKHGLTSAEGEKMEVIRRSAEFNIEADRLSIDISATAKRIESLERQLTATDSRMTTEIRTPARVLEDLQSKLYDLEQRRAQLLEKFQADYPPVVEVQAQIEKTRQSIRSYEQSPVREEVTNANPTHEWLESELARARALYAELTAKRARFQETLDRDRASVRRLETLDNRQKELLRDVAVKEKNYFNSLQKQENSRISEALDRSNHLNIAIAEQVKRPVLRTGPARFQLLFAAFLAAAAAACGLAFMADRLDPTFRSPEEVMRCLEIPVVVSVVKS